MLTKPEGEWIDCAIYGMETLQPFCVQGSLEPDLMICTVNLQSCYIDRRNT